MRRGPCAGWPLRPVVYLEEPLLKSRDLLLKPRLLSPLFGVLAHTLSEGGLRRRSFRFRFQRFALERLHLLRRRLRRRLEGLGGLLGGGFGGGELSAKRIQLGLVLRQDALCDDVAAHLKREGRRRRGGGESWERAARHSLSRCFSPGR